ncbi:MAG: ABC transporter ATP-binding protein [Gaiellaceae bacterium]
MTESLGPGVVRRRVLELVRPHALPLVVAAIAVVLSTLVTLAGPALVRYAVDEGIHNRDRGALNRAALVFLALALAKPLLVRAHVLLTARVGERFLGALRAAAFERLQALPLAFFEGERAGVLVARLTADVQSLTQFVRQVLVEVVGSMLLLVLTLVAMIVLSPLLTASMLVAVPVLAVSIGYFHRHSKPAYLAIRDRIGDTLSAVQEGVTGVKVVQAFGRERDQLARYGERSRAQISAWQNASYVNIRLFPSIAIAQVAAVAAVLLAGGVLYSRGEVSEGTIAAFLLYVTGLFDPIARLTEWLNELQSGRAALTKIVGLIETPAAIEERPDAGDLPPSGALSVRALSFEYETGKRVLHALDLEIPAGEHVALVGATGAGKSTLAKLLTRQYDPAEGAVRFGGVDLRDATLASLRERIALVPQEGHLFTGTIADNVRLARPDASDAEVEAALEHIGGLERFRRFHDGIGTDVQTRGVRLSAGERQLVGLARAALADPAVIVLDEATSSLDPGTEAAVERALARLTEGRTMVTIAHRLSTARRADRVAVLEHGRLVELGRHDELLQAGGVYARLWESWQRSGAAGSERLGRPAPRSTRRGPGAAARRRA